MVRIVEVRDLLRALVVTASVRIGSWLGVWLVAQGMNSTDAEKLLTAFGVIGGIAFDYAVSLYLKHKAKTNVGITANGRGLRYWRTSRGRGTPKEPGKVKDQIPVNNNKPNSPRKDGEGGRAERVQPSHALKGRWSSGVHRYDDNRQIQDEK